MLAIYKREMRAYFTSPIGYIFIAVFMAISGYSFGSATLGSNTTDSSGYFAMILVFFIVLIPLLTMKLLSEERKLKTEQILLTSPVSLVGMVTAKFLAAYTVFAGSFLVTNIVNFSTLASVASKQYEFIEKISIPTIAGSIVGILLLGGAMIAIGLFLSSLTENQLVAGVATIGALGLFFVFMRLPQYISNEALRVVVKWFSLFDRYYVFAQGILDIPALVYYISFIVIFLFLTIRIYEKRRWE